eukprot:546598_1
MREIVHLSVGRAGIYVGNDFWNTIRLEHGLNETGECNNSKLRAISKMNVYFEEHKQLHYRPRACLIDLDPTSLDVIKSSTIGQMFKTDNMCFGEASAHNIWAKGCYTDGAEIIDEIMDTIRNLVESCDNIESFQMTHSTGGGTGSGLGALIFMKIRDLYCSWMKSSKLSVSYPIYPTTEINEACPYEPYNVIWSIHMLLENCDLNFLMDNKALFNIAKTILKIKQPKYSDLNFLISNIMSDITAPLRFVGNKLNSDYRRLAVNLIPFPRLHFLACSQAPLFGVNDNTQKKKMSVGKLTGQMWSDSNLFSHFKYENGKYLSTTSIYRCMGNMVDYNLLIEGFIRKHFVRKLDGIMPMSVIDLFGQYYKFAYGDKNAADYFEIQNETAQICKLNGDDFVTWIPENCKASIINVPRYGCDESGTVISNTTAIKSVFDRMCIRWKKLYCDKRYKHLYSGEGHDE